MRVNLFMVLTPVSFNKHIFEHDYHKCQTLAQKGASENTAKIGNLVCI